MPVSYDIENDEPCPVSASADSLRSACCLIEHRLGRRSWAQVPRSHGRAGSSVGSAKTSLQVRTPVKVGQPRKFS